MIPNLPLPAAVRAKLGEDPAWFSSLIWDNYVLLQWRGIGTFAVGGSGRAIYYEVHPKTPESIVKAYLLNQVLSMALIRQGHDTLHGVACEWQGQACLFLGGSGFGKSSLLIHLLQQGARFISDDLLVTHRTDGTTYVHRGLPHIKLYPDSLARSQLEFAETISLNPYTEKNLCALASRYVHKESFVPIGRIYVLDLEATKNIELIRLAGVEKFTALAGNVFNSLDQDVPRKKLNLKYVAHWSHLPVSRLRYPRRFDIMPEVVARVLESDNENFCATPI